MPVIGWQNWRKRNGWKEQAMGKKQLRSKIEEQQSVYQALKAGNAGTVCYKELHNGEWGVDDENYTNRLRLAYYLLYCHDRG